MNQENQPIQIIEAEKIGYIIEYTQFGGRKIIKSVYFYDNCWWYCDWYGEWFVKKYEGKVYENKEKVE